jgi:DNA mismatch endonuclease (patch repair protein)
LPGKPDFVLKSSRLVVFIHGCFWHSHAGCKNAAVPTSNIDYWSEKLARNRRRDRQVRRAIRKMGWRTAVIWECKLRDTHLVARRLLKLTSHRGK